MDLHHVYSPGYMPEARFFAVTTKRGTIARMREVKVLQTYDSKGEALNDLPRYARELKERRMTPRYRVRVIPREGSYWIVLMDYGD